MCRTLSGVAPVSRVTFGFAIAVLTVHPTLVPTYGHREAQQLAPQVTPDGGTKKTAANVTGRTAIFAVLNQGPNDELFTLVCTRSGAVSACSSASSTLIAAGLTKNITVTYSTSAPQLGTLNLKATGSGGNDTGYFRITVQDSTGPTSSSISINSAPQNGEYLDVSRCVASCFDAVLSYSTPAYLSLDISRGVALVYRSAQAKLLGVVQVDATDTSTSQPIKMSIRLKRPDGSFVTFTTGSTEIFYQTGPGANRLAAQFDATAFATGAYKYTAVARSWFAGGSFNEATAPVRVFIVNETASPFGWGWSLVGLEKLYFQSDGSVVLVEGNGSAALFPLDLCPSGCTYSSPSGDFSTFSSRSSWADNIKYDRRYPDGTALAFYTDGRLATAKDRFGSTTQYSYDGSNRLATITDPAGKTITLYYGADAKLDSLKDAGGRKTRVTVDGALNVTELWDAAGIRALAVTYDASHRARVRTDRRGGLWGFRYDFAGKLGADTLPTITADGASLRPVVAYSSVEAGELVDPGSGYGTSANPAPRVMPGNLRAKVTNPRGFLTASLVDRFGAPLRVEEPLGLVTTIDRDANALVVRSVGPDGHIVKNTWSGPDLTQVFDSTAQQTVNYTYESTYHQVTQIKGDADSVWAYWSGGKLDSTRVGRSSQPVTRFTYDTRGRILSATDPGGHISAVTYDPSNWMNTISANLGATTIAYTYDSFGRTVSVRDQVGDTSRMTYDSLNRVTRTIGPIADTTRYIYDSIYLRQVIDPKGQVYQFGPNALGWVQTRTDPAGAQDGYSYDRNGNITQWINRRGQTITFSYDTLDMLLARIAGADTARYFTDPAGRFTSAANSESTDSLKLDAAGRPEYQITIRNGTRYELHALYETRALRTALQITSPWTDTITYHYNAYMMLDTLTDLAGGKTTIHYQQDVLPDTLTLPTGLKITGRFPSTHTAGELTFPNNGTLNQAIGVKYNYNDQGQVGDGYTWNLFAGREYRYDRAGRDTAFLDYYTDCTGDDLWDANHGYYCSVPLTKVYQPNQEHYTYDKVGNRTDLGAVIGTANRLLKFNGDTLVYDATGNLTRRAHNGQDTQRLYWNSLGQLVAVWTSGKDSVNLTYDAIGRRVRRWTPTATSRYIWDGDDLVAEVDGSGNRVAEYTYYPGIDQPHSQRRGTATTYYIEDFPGNVLGLVNSGNALVNQYKYKPYGADDGSPSPGVANTLQYAAREFDSETGLYYSRARYYDRQLGRFVSEDPIGLSGGINQYAYVGSDPVNANDPSGLIPPVAVVAGGVTVVTVVALAAAAATAIWISQHSASIWKKITSVTTCLFFCGELLERPIQPTIHNEPPPVAEEPEPVVRRRLPWERLPDNSGRGTPRPGRGPGVAFGPPWDGGSNVGGAAGSGGGGAWDTVTCFPIARYYIGPPNLPQPAGTMLFCSDGSVLWMK